MKNVLLLAAGMLLVNLASASDHPGCSQETEGKQSCMAGKTFKCTKVFDIPSKTVVYEWGILTASGLTIINANSPMLNKTPKYAPIVCHSS